MTLSATQYAMHEVNSSMCVFLENSRLTQNSPSWFFFARRTTGKLSHKCGFLLSFNVGRVPLKNHATVWVNSTQQTIFHLQCSVGKMAGAGDERSDKRLPELFTIYAKFI